MKKDRQILLVSWCWCFVSCVFLLLFFRRHHTSTGGVLRARKIGGGLAIRTMRQRFGFVSRLPGSILAFVLLNKRVCVTIEHWSEKPKDGWDEWIQFGHSQK